MLGLCCCVRAFSSCGKWASHCDGFCCCRAQAPDHRLQQLELRLSSHGFQALKHRFSSVVHGLSCPMHMESS